MLLNIQLKLIYIYLLSYYLCVCVCVCVSDLMASFYKREPYTETYVAIINAWVCQHFPFDEPQVPSDKFNPDKQVLLGGEDPLELS